MNRYGMAAIAALLIAIGPALNAQTLTNIDGDYPFTIQVPDDWDVADQANAETGGVTVQVSPNDDPPPAIMQINVIPQQDNSQGALGEVIVAAERAMESSGVAPEVIDKTDFDQAGMLGEVRTYRFDLGDREIIHRTAYIMGTNDMYAIAMTARADTADEYMAVFDRSLASFEER